MFHSRTRALATLWILAATIGTGCRAHPDMPQLYPVHGHLLDAKGKPLTGATVQFQPEADPTVSTRATTDAEGRFELTSFKAGAQAMGTVAGSHRVLVTPPADSRWKPRPFVLPAPCIVKPGENELTLVVR
jgi:hypothetical protein